MDETDQIVVNIEPAAPPSLENIRHLTNIQWEKALAKAKEVIGNRQISEPNRADFFQRESDYPPLLVNTVLVLLALVAAAAFFISAGKQVVAFDVISDPLHVRYSGRISQSYIDVIVIAALLLSEAGVILFGLASNIFTADRSRQRILRAFQVACMVIALSANISVTAQNLAADMPVFDWLVTFLAPIIVIGVGLVIEQLAHRWIIQRVRAVSDYNTALMDYKQVSAHPEKHPEWGAVWGAEILDALIRASASNRLLIEELIAIDPTCRREIVTREWARHQWSFDPEQLSKSPQVAAQLPVSGQPQLPPSTSGQQLPPVGAGLPNLPPRPKVKLEKTIAALNDHPEWASLNNSEVAEQIGDVSKELVRQARAAIRESSIEVGVQP